MWKPPTKQTLRAASEVEMENPTLQNHHDLTRILRWDAEQTYNQNLKLHEEHTGTYSSYTNDYTPTETSQLYSSSSSLKTTTRSLSRDLLSRQTAFLKPSSTHLTQLKQATEHYYNAKSAKHKKAKLRLRLNEILTRARHEAVNSN